jgi:DNA-binding transcriptional MocR family regulator
MDQDLAWWASVVFDGWRDRSGPRYQRLAGCLLDGVTSGTLAAGTRVPAERVLAPVVGVSRGTVVACFDQLVSAGVLRRQVGAGTFVVGRPSWAANGQFSGQFSGRSSGRSSGRVAGPLLRQSTSGIDLSLSYPADLRHLPPVSLDAGWAALDGEGLELAGLPVLRSAVAEYLTSFQQLPTSADQIVATAGAQEALWLLGRVLRPGRVLANCPTYPGLVSAFGSGRVAAAADTRAFARAPAGSAAYVMPTGHNPVGSVLPSLWRQSMAAVADSGRVTVVEDLALADLRLSSPLAPTPLAAMSPEVVAVGSASKLFWGGLRVGWIRIPSESLRSAVVAAKLPTSALSQVTAASLLSGVTADWLSGLHGVLRERRDHLCALIGTQLPAWRVPEVPEAGLSLWVSLPVVDASTFAAVAARYGVRVLPGTAACVCGRHRGFIRLSFASQPDTLSMAVERLAVAWEVHAENLAALLLRLLPAAALLLVVELVVLLDEAPELFRVRPFQRDPGCRYELEQILGADNDVNRDVSVLT